MTERSLRYVLDATGKCFCADAMSQQNRAVLAAIEAFMQTQKIPKSFVRPTISSQKSVCCLYGKRGFLEKIISQNMRNF